MQRFILMVLVVVVLSGAGIGNAAVQVVFIDFDGHGASARHGKPAPDLLDVTRAGAEDPPDMFGATAQRGYPTPAIGDVFGFPPGHNIANGAMLKHWRRGDKSSFPHSSGANQAPGLANLFSNGSDKTPLAAGLDVMQADVLASIIANEKADWVAKSKLGDSDVNHVGVGGEAHPVPEPAAAVIWLALGCLGLGFVCWRRRPALKRGPTVEPRGPDGPTRAK